MDAAEEEREQLLGRLAPSRGRAPRRFDRYRTARNTDAGTGQHALPGNPYRGGGGEHPNGPPRRAAVDLNRKGRKFLHAAEVLRCGDCASLLSIPSSEVAGRTGNFP